MQVMAWDVAEKVRFATDSGPKLTPRTMLVTDSSPATWPTVTSPGVTAILVTGDADRNEVQTMSGGNHATYVPNMED